MPEQSRPQGVHAQSYVHSRAVGQERSQSCLNTQAEDQHSVPGGEDKRTRGGEDRTVGQEEERTVGQEEKRRREQDNKSIGGENKKRTRGEEETKVSVLKIKT